jgi:hypothetical protein
VPITYINLQSFESFTVDICLCDIFVEHLILKTDSSHVCIRENSIVVVESDIYLSHWLHPTKPSFARCKYSRHSGEPIPDSMLRTWYFIAYIELFVRWFLSRQRFLSIDIWTCILFETGSLRLSCDRLSPLSVIWKWVKRLSRFRSSRILRSNT